ncbi:hypothetical protein [Chelatococcus reniformis]|uniref:Uncharacterized protein n=1 Tax=Chelatococcus reniformis TaxID=1494448 RepID=A0A916XMT7_9HYPH|nr:hypothetical protein [Chelatococcus reniformis]GGC87875.1 hypothetical protein GCM10010994_52320 [Chelatococcus reniformis]
MDGKLIRRALEHAEQHVVECEPLIEGQRALAASLPSGEARDEAERLLREFEALQAEQIAHRDRLQAELGRIAPGLMSAEVLDEIVFAHVVAHGQTSAPSDEMIAALAKCAGASELHVRARFAEILAEGWSDFDFHGPYRLRKKLVAEAMRRGVPVRGYIAAVLHGAKEARAGEPVVAAPLQPPTPQ